MDGKSNSPIDVKTLALLQSLRTTVRAAGDWKAAFDKFLALVRSHFIYDNVALYLVDSRTRSLEVRHARAVGRGRTSEADISWGEGVAGRVMVIKDTILEDPGAGPHKDRLRAPYLIGLPLLVADRLEGALVFVRFGGPPFSQEDQLLAQWIADIVGSLLESRSLRETRGEIESVHRQMRLQDDFVSNVSHELRTPLGFIKGYSSSLLRADTTWDKETEREFLSIIEEESDRLTQLIDNMLESARFQSKTARFRFQPLQIDALIRDTAMRMRAHQPDLKIEMDFESVPPILGDSVRLSQVFENLFGNALKYAPGSPLTIKLVCDKKKVRITFADHGPGIPEEYVPFIFQRFYRVPADGGSTGTGLGLYICQQIVKAHHGKIWAESALDRGATFIIELPLHTSSSSGA
jgi:signal transduction histidine kinase